MSKVIGFRLDSDNPREAQALMILQQWQERGYSTRHVLTEALIRLEHDEEDEPTQFNEIVMVLRQVQEQLEHIQHSDLRLSTAQQRQATLSDAFLGSVRQAARPGMQLND